MQIDCSDRLRGLGGAYDTETTVPTGSIAAQATLDTVYRSMELRCMEWILANADKVYCTKTGSTVVHTRLRTPELCSVESPIYKREL